MYVYAQKHWSRGATPSYGKEGLVNVAQGSGLVHTVLLKIKESNQIRSIT